MRAATARSGSGLRAAWVKLWTRCGCNGVRITKKGRGFTPRPRETRKQALRPVQYGLPVHADAEPQDTRRGDRLNEVRVRAVLRAANRLLRVRVGHVEDVDAGDDPNRSRLDRPLDVEVEVLVGRQPAVADVVDQQADGAGAVGT